MDRWLKIALLVLVATTTACAAPGEDDADDAEETETATDAIANGWVPANTTAGACVGRSVTPAAFNRPMSVSVSNNCGYDVVISVGYKEGINPREQNTPCFVVGKGRSGRITPNPRLINGTQTTRYDRVQICKKR